ncbi:MAG: ATP-dependent zinc protease [Bacteroidota bacterium]|jgi:hypothetical protein
MKKRIRPLTIIGRYESVRFCSLSNEWIQAKIDTGAYTSSLHCLNIHEQVLEGKNKLCFSIFSDNPVQRNYCFEHFSKKKIKSSTGEIEERYVIKTLIEIAGRKIMSTISLADRGSMKFPVLIGRKLLKKKFLVDVDKSFIGGLHTENIK